MLIGSQELKIAVSDRLIRTGKYRTMYGTKRCAVRLHLPDGEELDPKSWVKLSASGDLPTMKVSMEWVAPSPTLSSRSSSSRSGSTSGSTSTDSLDLDDDRGRGRHKRNSKEHSTGPLPAYPRDKSTRGRKKTVDGEVDFILISKEETPDGKWNGPIKP